MLIKQLQKIYSITFITTSLFAFSPHLLHTMQKSAYAPANRLAFIGAGIMLLGNTMLQQAYAKPFSKDFSRDATTGAIMRSFGGGLLANALIFAWAKCNLDYFISDDRMFWAKIWVILGANVNERNEQGKTPLILAIEKGENGPSNYEFIKLLINHGANVNAHCFWGVSALMYAATAGHLSVVKMLIDEGANAGESLFGETAIFDAEINPGDGPEKQVERRNIQRLLRFHSAKQSIARISVLHLQKYKEIATWHQIFEKYLKQKEDYEIIASVNYDIIDHLAPFVMQ